MARHHAALLTAIWSDPDWVALSPTAQRLYMLLLSQGRLSLVGHIDLMPHRWAALARGTTVETVTADLWELEAARFVAVDNETQEVLVRTFVRHDVQPHRFNRNLAKGLWGAWDTILSPTLRKIAVDNLPEFVWDRSLESVPDSVPETATQMRRSPRLEPPVPTSGPDERSEPPVETNGSNHPSEPLVRTPSLLPPPSSLHPPSTAAAHVTRADSPDADERRQQQQPVDNSARGEAAHQRPEAQRQELITAASAVLAHRRAEHRPDVGEGWIRSAARGIAKDRHADAHALLLNRPSDQPLPTPDELADMLEPPRPTAGPSPPAVDDRSRPADFTGLTGPPPDIDTNLGGIDGARDALRRPRPEP